MHAKKGVGCMKCHVAPKDDMMAAQWGAVKEKESGFQMAVVVREYRRRDLHQDRPANGRRGRSHRR